MNNFVARFSKTSAESELRRAQALAADDGDFTDSAWGSEAGFGNLSKGIPTFALPGVADVRLSLYIDYSTDEGTIPAACSPPHSCACTRTISRTLAAR